MNIRTVQHGRLGGFIVNGTLSVPASSGNRYHRAVQDWIAAGNVPALADPDPAFAPSDLAIRLLALEAKTGVTDADRAAAKAELMTKGGQ